MTSSRFATIHGGLLARKGEAAPAIRHPEHQVSYGDHSPVSGRAGGPIPGYPSTRHGQATELSTSAPVPEPVWRQAPARPAVTQSRPAAPVGEAPASAEGTTDGACNRQGKGSAGRMPRARMSVRLSDRQRHLVRIATAVLGRSQQALLSDALDGHLEKLAATELRSCACFTRRAAGDGTSGSAPRSQQ